MGASVTFDNDVPQSAPDPPPKKVKKQLPQKNIDELWEAFNTKYPGKVHSILPNNVYAETKAAKAPKGIVHGQKAGKSYDEAAAECRHAVEKIAKECRRVNMKYRDVHFDIESDLKRGIRDCLDGLVRGESTYDLTPKSCKRVTVRFIPACGLPRETPLMRFSKSMRTPSSLREALPPVTSARAIMETAGSCLPYVH